MRRPLLINGFMATGKSTVGKLVSEWCGRPFIDLDERVAETTGLAVPELFAARGETGFRAAERQALDAILAESAAPVVALGGGALLDRGTRLHALDRAVVVTLDATREDILSRTAGDRSRPLLQVDDPGARIDRLRAERRITYAETHATIQTSSRPAEDVARDAIAVWRRDPTAVAAGESSYAVEVGRDVVTERLPGLLAGASMAFLVTDQNVRGHHGDATENAMELAGLRTATVVLEPGEEHKDAASLEHIWNAALAAKVDRKSRFVGLGGGVVTDVTGFAAATWMRGVQWIGLPTTLLAMVDASVGGKTAIDLKQAKNVVGAFWQPMAVLCDIAFLSTEPPRGYASALAEVVKTAIIGDPDLFTLVEQHASEIRSKDPDLVAEVVRRCIRVKARVVSIDEREDGLRACLNLGHTVGHALEAYGGYGKLRHGEAVSLGLVAALRIGERLGITERALTERCIIALRVLGLPIDLTSQPLARAVELIGNDKKRTAGGIRFIAARNVGNVELVDLPVEELRGHVLALGGS